MQLPKTKVVELSALTAAMKAVVPALEGLTEHDTTIEVRRFSGEFTLSEQALIRQTLASHDAEAIRKANAARQAQQQAERDKDPTTLSVPERVKRLEAILGVN